MRASLLSAICLAAIALPAKGVEVLETGRFIPDPLEPGAPPPPFFFGVPIAAGSGLVVVAEPGVGSLYVYDPQSGTQVNKITPESGSVAEEFGISMAMEDSIAIVGSFGAAYLYDIESGARIREFVPTTPLPSGATFGRGVAIGDGVALVASSISRSNTDPTAKNRVYAFDVMTGEEITTFEPTLPRSAFGSSIGVSDGVAVIAAMEDKEGGVDAGAAYLFDIESGEQIIKLTGSAPLSYFAAGAAIDDGTVFLGEPSSTNDPTREIGLYDAATGDRLGRLTADTGASDPSFGSFMSADSGRLLVGSIVEGNGHAYLFDAATQTQIARFTSSDSDTNFEFGHGVALSGQYAGALASGGTTAAYTFVILPEPGAVLLATIAMAGALRQRRHGR